jgi:hypothetical protein
MKLRDWLFNSFFIRNMLATFGNRTPYFFKERAITPYFRYKIGNYESTHELCFRKPPNLEAYKNEVFNKMEEYSGIDLTAYLEFHYQAYSDKPAFLRFLQYEISERTKRRVARNYKRKLESTLEWLTEKREEERARLAQVATEEIQCELQGAVANQVVAATDPVENLSAVSQDFAARMEKLAAETEEKVGSLTGSLITGKIELNSQENLDSIIQLYLLIMDIKLRRGSREEKLFKRHSKMDIASILRLHYRAFQGKQINTVQARITEVQDNLKINNQKIQNLNKALVEFFY